MPDVKAAGDARRGSAHLVGAASHQAADRANPIVGRSECLVQAIHRLEAIAPTDAEVILTGPSGVGKELFARYIHDASGRTGEFVAVNCGAIPHELFENEMFGHVAGAFTGARARHDGLIAHARGGTLFLDEVHALALSSQVKLLRLLQEGEYRYLGDARVQLADVRVIAATNVDLRKEMDNGAFRQDLFYRLHVVPVRIPPLRERPEDIESLLAYFAERFAKRYGVPRIEITEDALARLLMYSWPGNVRELENRVRCLTCLRLARPIRVEDLDLDVPDAASTIVVSRRSLDKTFRGAKAELIEKFERDYVKQALAHTNGNVTAAARRSGKPRRAFFQLMRRLGIDPEPFRGTPDETRQDYHAHRADPAEPPRSASRHS